MIAVNETTCFAKYMQTKPNEKTSLTKFTFHGREIKEDEGAVTNLDEYIKRAAEFKIKTLAYISNPMQNAWEEESPIENYVCDALTSEANGDFCLFNAGGIRTGWEKGNLTYYNLFQSFPFDNTMTTFEVNGQDLITMMRILQQGSKGFYHTSGLRMEVCKSPHSLKSVSFLNGQTIDPTKTYLGVSNDFLVNGGDDFKDVLKAIKIKNVKFGRALRDVLTDALLKSGVVNSDQKPCVDPQNPRLIVQDCHV